MSCRALSAVWLLPLALGLSACGGGGAPVPQGFAAAAAASAGQASAGQPSRRALAAGPSVTTPPNHYDLDTGMLWLRALPVTEGTSTICYDVSLRLHTATPLVLEVASAAAATCTAAPTAPGGYDAVTGRLSLPGMTVARGDGARTCYDVVMRLVNPAPVRLQLQSAQEAGCAAGPVVLGSFQGDIVLGSPTDSSIRANVFSPDQSGTVWLVYGSQSGVYTRRTAAVPLVAGQPVELMLDGLTADAEYHYRLHHQTVSGADSGLSEEYRFHTARAAGQSFRFTLQADSHLDENSDIDVYHQTLANVRNDAPDFHIDLGDTFMTEKHTAPLSATVQSATDAATVNARYAYERGNFAIASHSVPLFLVNGNHDGELGWLNDGTAQNLAVWTTQARQRYFVNPQAGAFYSGDGAQEAFVGQRAAWYAWHWGDALFVVLDPYWNSAKLSGGDAWGYTLGPRQYQWLSETLAASKARFKFVFVHNLVGGLDGQMRGGVEAAPYFEWGGLGSNGVSAFAQKRPGWAKPIHPLLVEHRVTAVFHGHDHLYARQTLDGVVYQEVPQPSAKNFSSGASLAKDYHYASGTIQSSSGHLRVTVTPAGVSSEYVRSWLPRQETTQRRNGQVDDRWQAAPAAAAVRPQADLALARAR